MSSMNDHGSAAEARKRPKIHPQSIAETAATMYPFNGASIKIAAIHPPNAKASLHFNGKKRALQEPLQL
ncbi:hypothetical protein EJB05_50873, partial [Eragrostis curvula]